MENTDTLLITVHDWRSLNHHHSVRCCESSCPSLSLSLQKPTHALNHFARGAPPHLSQQSGVRDEEGSTATTRQTKNKIMATWWRSTVRPRHMRPPPSSHRNEASGERGGGTCEGASIEERQRHPTHSLPSPTTSREGRAWRDQCVSTIKTTELTRAMVHPPPHPCHAHTSLPSTHPRGAESALSFRYRFKSHNRTEKKRT